ncbi:hypothetical protein HSRCO_0266 [Halanaeroarchaeum sp. HSR-CO]|uniref:hypothetical protein n=1 Tax=Halanaeroarchaeum sp. HSR-CO TaxID=2866382 RepID=UPI00217DBBF0|nr:hypothetical protein [Halanaeroarchaeum sp. HSR-CO]UWG46565.1 hypothetical protein HSRCO_0266 [Halanaeroarchaeum sp. HSR-CO]
MSGQTKSPDSSVPLSSLTTRTKAKKVLNADLAETLQATFETNREVYVRGTDAGLYVVGYGSGGGLYMARILAPDVVENMLSGATCRVIHDETALPHAVRYPAFEENDDE